MRDAGHQQVRPDLASDEPALAMQAAGLLNHTGTPDEEMVMVPRFPGRRHYPCAMLHNDYNLCYPTGLYLAEDVEGT